MEMRSPPDVPPHSSSLPNREDHSSSTQVESNELSQANSESIPADFDSYRDNLKKAKTSHVKSELELYLEEEELPRLEGVHFDILTWWNSNGLKYPTLQAIARDVLAVPVSTVASESSFSTGGRVVTPSRNRLHPKTLEALMCTQSWLAAFEDGDIPTINDEDMDVDECMSGVTYIDD